MESILARELSAGEFSLVLASGWDNTPRSGEQGWLLTGYVPENLAAFAACPNRTGRRSRLRRAHCLHQVMERERAEGNHMEPDQRWGHACLDAIRAVLL
jgi:hypothetical protein